MDVPCLQGSDRNTFILTSAAYQRHIITSGSPSLQFVGLTLTGPSVTQDGGGITVNAAAKARFGTQDVVFRSISNGPPVSVYQAELVSVR